MISLWPRSSVAELVPSGRPTVFGTGAYTALSVALHATLLVAGVALTGSPPGYAGAREHPVFYLFPPDRVPAEPGSTERVRYVRSDLPGTFSVAGDAPEVRRAASSPLPTEAPDSVATTAVEPQEGNDSVYSVLQVDSAARRHPWSAAPAYPRAMLEHGIEGFVAAQYVVDTTGLADTATFRVFSSTHPDFADAVRAALPGMRFTPAKIGSQPVRLLVEQTFTFRMRRAEQASDSSARPQVRPPTLPAEQRPPP